MKAAHRPRPRSAQNLDRARENSQRLVRPSTAAGKLSVFSTESSLWPSSVSSNPLLFIADDAFERHSSVQSAAAADWPESDLREQQTTTAAVSGASFSPVLHPESFEREWNIMQAELQRCMRVRSKAALEVEEERIMHRGEVARLKGMLEKERSDKQAVSSSVVELQQELSDVKQLLLRHSSLDEAKFSPFPSPAVPARAVRETSRRCWRAAQTNEQTNKQTRTRLRRNLQFSQ